MSGISEAVRVQVDAFLQIEPIEQIRLLREAADAAERGEDEISMLERASKLSYGDFDAAWRLLDQAPNSGRHTFLHAAVLALIWSNRPIPPSEADIRREFYARLDEFLPGATQIEYRCIQRNIPDGMIAWKSCEMPVEIKKDSFGAKGREQLLRYMRTYDCEHGIAVAPELACTLPDNMTFVKVSLPRRRPSAGEDPA